MATLSMTGSASRRDFSHSSSSAATFRPVHNQPNFRLIANTKPKIRYSTRPLRSERGPVSKPSPAVPRLNHLDNQSQAHMVSIADKVSTRRSATAFCFLGFSHPDTFEALDQARLQKGDAIAVARIAGIQAAKKTADLIPLAHPALSITGVTIDLLPFSGKNPPDKAHHSLPPGTYTYGGVIITATVDCEGKTGVEMEAMTAASVTGLTMYDMLKGVDKAMELTSVRVVAKTGGKSGNWTYSWEQRQNRPVPQPGVKTYRPKLKRDGHGPTERNNRSKIPEEDDEINPSTSHHNDSSRETFHPKNASTDSSTNDNDSTDMLETAQNQHSSDPSSPSSSSSSSPPPPPPTSSARTFYEQQMLQYTQQKQDEFDKGLLIADLSGNKIGSTGTTTTDQAETPFYRLVKRGNVTGEDLYRARLERYMRHGASRRGHVRAHHSRS
ncbi:hypothetical protein B0A52_08746 [Exophiala mesophila]|uniref:cyclic pyranopterin monophosphate synthase n=1 Tax=Exophiala mesophila TaxID=212818 RepID=A0A438MWU7_EXOME|nr:hypothetical protein B0A52_08746 [Exophiala mesophila]